MATLYKGISFARYKDRKNLNLSDIELVKQDLLNHISTKLNERRMMPEFGTRIPILAFEPMTDDLLFAIEDDLVAVVNYDPRVEFSSTGGPFGDGVSLFPDYDRNIVIASMDLLFVELNITESMDLNIDLSQ